MRFLHACAAGNPAIGCAPRMNGEIRLAKALAAWAITTVCCAHGRTASRKRIAGAVHTLSVRTGALELLVHGRILVLQFSTKGRCCGQRNYAKPHRQDGSVAGLPQTWCSALSRLKQRRDQRVWCFEATATQTRGATSHGSRIPDSGFRVVLSRRVRW